MLRRSITTSRSRVTGRVAARGGSPLRGHGGLALHWLIALLVLGAVMAPASVAAQDATAPPIVEDDQAAEPVVVDDASAVDDPSATVDADQDTALFPSDWSPPRTVYIPETGHAIDGWFLDLWREAGGANAYGYPITPEIWLDNGHVVQYYSYARFEYWPEGDTNGNYVKVAPIGEEIRPPMLPRGIGGKLDRRDMELARAAQAWLPLPESKLQDDSETWRYVPETGHSIYDGFKTFWEVSGEQWYLGFPVTEEYILDGISYQIFERGALTWQPGADIAMIPLGRMLAQRYGLDTTPLGQGDLPAYSESLFVPPAPQTIPDRVEAVGADPDGERWLEIDLGDQSMKAWQGDTVILETLVSTGKDDFETPTGSYFVNSKVKEQDMEGVLGGEYYDVPKVPDVMYFTDRGHAIHGAYWHDNFGNRMSHGCINLPLDVADFIYEWASVGIRVEIHD